jgi:anaerobic selenocysteine-containing dehydrogenase
MQPYSANQSRQQSSPTPSQPAAAGSPAVSLAACVYLALECPCCGDVRQARAALPSVSHVICPQCGTSCGFIYLGQGCTTRKLPFSEVRRAQPGLLHRRDEVP